MTSIKSDYARFASLTFTDFQKMASDDSLTCYEKIGFPNAYRQNSEEYIFADILSKLTRLQQQNQVVLDIGPGCSRLPIQLIELCRKKNHQLFLIDSEEMLNQLPDEKFITKIPALYPTGCKKFILDQQKNIDVILSYSVLQYVFVEGNLFEFLDDSLSLLKDGGQFLVGDVPNSMKRKRFLESAQGIQYHQQHYDAHTLPKIKYNTLEPQQIDDAVVMAILQRCRNYGFDAYIMPQMANLPMANRREDILIVKP
jgi:hypothetical protein